jgi:hypothetical protein
MKTIVKLAIMMAVLNALFHGAEATWKHYGLTDDARQVVLFGSQLSTAEVHERILLKAAERGLPLQPEDLQVDRVTQRTMVEGHYVNPIEFFPGYRRPVTLSFTVDETVVRPPTAGDVLPAQ